MKLEIKLLFKMFILFKNELTTFLTYMINKLQENNIFYKYTNHN